MSIKKKSFCVICIANYCRSPVLEHLLKKRYPQHEFFSAGLSPLFEPNMDIRSSNFLEKNNVHNILHSPKKLSKKILNYFDYIVAVDIIVLNELNKIFPKYSFKFKLATSQFKNIELNDPYHLSDIEYEDIMEKILYVSKNIDLDII